MEWPLRYRNATAHAMAGSLLACAATVSAVSDRADRAANAASADLIDLSLEQLLDVEVVGASKYAQKQSQVAAAVNVLTRDEIRGRARSAWAKHARLGAANSTAA